jgi:hypothetical protein
MARRCWKHSRQKTGRPCVGRKGTVVSLPHCEQVVLVSERICVAPPPPPGPAPSARLALQPLQRLGSFLKPLSAKNICSPAVKTNSAPHSEHFRTLSWNSMSRPPWPSSGSGDGAPCTKGPGDRIPRSGGNRVHGLLGPEGTSCNATPTSLLHRVYITEVRR